ncbi:Nramp family divalent metal transporter [bacterium]|nr:Nramp family divalent metal transporter [bacterium]
MPHDFSVLSPIRRIWLVMLSVGPGIFCIGYTIGTGSVTSMAKAGSQFGMELTWVLFLSCLFSWVLMEAYGRLAVITGETSMHGFRNGLRFGKPLAIITMTGVIIAQWNSLTGILGLCSTALYEGLNIFIPGLTLPRYGTVLGIAIVVILIMYAFLWVGRYSFFEKILVFFVTLMGLSFIISMVVVFPSPKEIAAGFIPRIPGAEGGKLMVAAFVGTTMAAPTFVVRPLLMKGKGWTAANSRDQSRDALISALLMFVISASIMVAATGALFHRGHAIEKVLDMVYTLEPIAGKYAVGIFLVGTLSAGLSSVFPILMVAPLLIGDYRAGTLDTRSRLFRILTGIACLFGLTVPIFGANPIAAQIATQVAGVFVLPVVIFGIIVLVNRRDTMGEHRAGILLNTGLAASFIFSCIISYTGIRALTEFFGG